MMINTLKPFLVALLYGLMTISAEGSRDCNDLRKQYSKRGFLAPSELKDYCDNKCTFILGYECRNPRRLNEDEGFFDAILDDMMVYLHEVMQGKVKPSMFFDVPGDMVPLIVLFFVPYLLAIIPIFLQWVIIGSRAAHDATNRGWVIVLNLFIWVAFVTVFWGQWSSLLYYTVFAYLSAFSTIQSRVFSELIVSYFCMAILALLCIGQTNAVIQVVGSSAIVVLILGIFFKAVGTGNEESRVSVLTSLASIFMALSFMDFLMQEYAVRNPAMAMIRLGIYAMIPSGVDSALLINAMVMASDLVMVLQIPNAPFSVGLFIVASIWYVLLYFVSRACIGMMVLSRLKFGWNFNAITTGFYSYAIDIFGPITGFITCIFDRDQRSSRRFMYCSLMLVLTACELRFAQDVLLLRFLLLSLDVVFLRSGLLDASRFLDCDINLSGMAFPQVGAFPFTSLDRLNEIRKSVYRLSLQVSVDDKESNAYGVGTAIGKDGSTYLVTARHCLMDKQRVVFDEGRCMEEIRTAYTVGSSCDPTVTMPTLCTPSCTVNLPFLVTNEIKSVTHLFMLSPEGMIGTVTGFKFRDDGDLYASISLRQGDSGSPLVAILQDGSIRLAGTVSRGSRQEGQGNIISCVATEKRFMTGSPGYEEPYLELKNVSTETDFRILKEIEGILRHENELRDQLDPLDNWDQKKDESQYDEMPPEERRKRRQRRKNWKKDAAQRKRVLTALLNTSKLKDEQKDIALADFDAGRVRKFNIQRQQFRPGNGLGFVPGT